MPEIEFSIRDFCYPLSIARLRREFARNQWRDPAQLQAWQDQRLQRVVQTAYAKVPHWQQLMARRGVKPEDIRTAADLPHLPILTKDDVRRLGATLHATDARRHRPAQAFTSGTTGLPVAFLVDRHARALEFVYYWRHWSQAGYRLGSAFAQLNAGHFAHRREYTRVARWQPHLRRLLLNSNALHERLIPEFAAALRARRPRFLKGLASPLYFLALLLQEQGIRDLRLDAVFATGEMLYPARRRVIEAAFQCRVLDSYGMLEQAASIAQCPAGSYHVNQDYCVHEFVPAPVANGETRLHSVIGTTLHNQAMPLLRYDTGDLVELLPAGSRCPCGRTLPLVKAIHGRHEDAVVTPDGRYVTSLFLVPEMVAGVGVTQFVQDDERNLEVRFVPLADGTTTDRAAQLAHHVRALVGDAVRVHVQSVSPDAIQRGPTGKVPLVVTRVARGVAR